jgi:large subunit ribosomal protein L22
MKAFLKNYRQSPRKVRLVANAVKGKSITSAEQILSFMLKRAGEPMMKLIQSAAANARAQGISSDGLIVKNIEVNKGITLKRMMPRAMGVGKRINKRSSHIKVELGESK